MTAELETMPMLAEKELEEETTLRTETPLVAKRMLQRGEELKLVCYRNHKPATCLTSTVSAYPS